MVHVTLVGGSGTRQMGLDQMERENRDGRKLITCLSAPRRVGVGREHRHW